jgi:DNA-binding response OmpR family regulator
MKKILVADQEKALCMLYAEELIEEGYEVVSISAVSNDLMAMVESESPDLLY